MGNVILKKYIKKDLGGNKMIYFAKYGVSHGSIKVKNKNLFNKFASGEDGIFTRVFEYGLWRRIVCI